MTRPLSTSADYWIDCTTCGNDPEHRLGCNRCDGRGVLVSDEERRAADRPAGDPVWTELARADARAMNLVTASRDEWKAKAERLERENRRMREAIDKAARVIESKLSRKPSPVPTVSGGHPTQPATAGGGFNQQEDAR